MTIDVVQVVQVVDRIEIMQCSYVYEVVVEMLGVRIWNKQDCGHWRDIEKKVAILFCLPTSRGIKWHELVTEAAREIDTSEVSRALVECIYGEH